MICLLIIGITNIPQPALAVRRLHDAGYSAWWMFLLIVPVLGWIAFTVFAFLISNVGLTKIIEYSLPVLMLLYPLTVVLIILSLFDKKFESSHRVYIWTTIGAALPAICDFIKTLPFGIDVSFASKVFPLYDLGFGWIVPALIGFIIGMIRHKMSYSRFTEMMLDSDKQADEKKEE